jgi:hypothetical protein
MDESMNPDSGLRKMSEELHFGAIALRRLTAMKRGDFLEEETMAK